MNYVINFDESLLAKGKSCTNERNKETKAINISIFKELYFLIFLIDVMT